MSNKNVTSDNIFLVTYFFQNVGQEAELFIVILLFYLMAGVTPPSTVNVENVTQRSQQDSSAIARSSAPQTLGASLMTTPAVLSAPVFLSSTTALGNVSQ